MYAITHAPYTGSTVADGTAGPPQYGTAVNREVYGWYPQASQVPVGNDDVSLRVITSLIVLVPDASVFKAGDRIALPGGDIDDDADAFRVSRDVRDYTTGPFGYKPGGEVVVEKVSG